MKERREISPQTHAWTLHGLDSKSDQPKDENCATRECCCWRVRSVLKSCVDNDDGDLSSPNRAMEVWEGKSWSSKNGPGLPKVPQNSTEPLGFCRKVLQNILHSEKLVEERFCRTLGAKPSFSGPANSSPKVCDATCCCNPRCDSRDFRAFDETKTSDLCSAMYIAENHLCNAFSLRFALSLRTSTAIQATMQGSLRVRCCGMVSLDGDVGIDLELQLPLPVAFLPAEFPRDANCELRYLYLCLAYSSGFKNHLWQKCLKNCFDNDDGDSIHAEVDCICTQQAARRWGAEVAHLRRVVVEPTWSTTISRQSRPHNLLQPWRRLAVRKN